MPGALQAQALPEIGKDWVLRSPIASTNPYGGTAEDLNAVAARASVSAGSNPAVRPALEALYIAVGANGAAASANNTSETWTPRPIRTAPTAAPITATLNAIVYPPSPTTAANLTPPAPYETFVAVGEGGTVVTTKDAVTWTHTQLSGGENLIRLVWNGFQYVALAEGAPAKIYTSPDAVTWTGPTTISSVAVRDLIWIEPSQASTNTAADMFVGLTDTGYITTNITIDDVTDNVANPLSWTGNTAFTGLPTGFQPTAITWSNGRKFVIVGTSDFGEHVWELSTLVGGTWVNKTPSFFSPNPVRIFSLAPVVSGSDAMVTFDANPGVNQGVGTVGGVWNTTVPAENGTDSPLAFRAAAKIPGTSTTIIVGEAGRVILGNYSTSGVPAQGFFSWTTRYSTGQSQKLYSAAWNGRMVSVTDAGELIYSSDGTYWTKVSGSITDGTAVSSEAWTPTALLDVAWNGSVFLAVGDAGTILSSPDGVSWTMRAPRNGFAQTDGIPLRSIAWDGTAFIVGGGSSAGAIFRSVDLVNWAFIDPGMNPIKRLFYNGSKFVALDDSSTASSVNPNRGTTWTGRVAFPDSLMAAFGVSHVAPFTAEENALVSDIIFDGSRFVATGSRSTDGGITIIGTGIATGPDVTAGTTWTSRVPVGVTSRMGSAVRVGRSRMSDPFKNEVLMFDLSVSGNLLRTTDTTNTSKYSSLLTGVSSMPRSAIRVGPRTVLVGDNGTILTNDDTIGTWAPRRSGTAANITGIAINGELLTGGAAPQGRLLMHSDSATFASDTGYGQPSTLSNTGLDSSAKLRSIVWTGERYLAVDSQENGSVYASTNGVDWTNEVFQQSPEFYRIGIAGTMPVVVGEDQVTATSAIYTYKKVGSATTATWQAVATVPSIGRLQSIAAKSDRIVVGGTSNRFVTSTAAGDTWTQASGAAGASGDIRDIEWNGSVFVAVTSNGDIQTSPDGSAWTKRYDYDGALNTVLWTGVQFVAMGDDGACLASFNGFVWRDQSLATDRDIYDAVWAGYGIIAVGDKGNVILSEGFERDQPTLSFLNPASSVSESGGSITVTVNLSPSSGTEQRVRVNLSGTATLGTTGDYLLTAPSTQNLVFAPGETSKTITFTIREDLIDEPVFSGGPEENFILSLDSSTATLIGEAKIGSIATHTVTITDNDQVPTFTAHPQNQLVATGGAMAPFSYTAEGTPTMAIQWRKGGKAILCADNPTYSIANVTAADAGVYDVQLTNSIVGGRRDSNDAQLGVVDGTTRVLTVLAGAPTTALTQAAFGTQVALYSYSWKKGTTPLNGTPVSADANHLTPLSRTLTIRNASAATDNGVYVCTVGAFGQFVDGGAVSLYVITPADKPVVTAPTNITRMVSELIDITPVATNYPGRWTITGLPPGVSFNAVTGRIVGFPTTRSKPGAPYKVKLVAANAAGASAPVEFQIDVNADLPTGIAGLYTARIAPDEDANHNLGGRVEFTVMPNGTYTGKAFLAASTISIKGAISAATSGTVHTTSTSFIGVCGVPVTLALTINTSIAGGEVVSGSLGSAAVTGGWRYPWTKTVLATNYTSALTYNVGLQIAPGDEVPANPNGTGYTTFKVAPDGKLSAAFSFADGTTVTQASFVSATGKVMFYAPLYKGTGSLSEGLTIAPTTRIVSGQPVWLKLPQPAASTDLVYKSGFGPLTLDAIGGVYKAPTGTGIIMGLNPVANNLDVDITIEENGPAVGTPAPTAITIAPTVTSPANVVMPTTNPSKVALKLTATSGLFSGTFDLVNPAPYNSALNIPRPKVAFKGIIFPDAMDQPQGAGFFLLPELPASTLETLAKTKRNSGLVTLTKVP